MGIKTGGITSYTGEFLMNITEYTEFIISGGTDHGIVPFGRSIV